MQPTQLICLKVNLPYYDYPSSNPAVPNSQPLLHILKERNQISAAITSAISATVPAPYLLDSSAFRAHEDQRVVLVDVRDDGGHFVNGVGEDGLAAHHLGHAQRRVHVEATEVVVDGQELRWRRGGEYITNPIHFPALVLEIQTRRPLLRPALHEFFFGMELHATKVFSGGGLG